jgi:hypothetical protein
MVELGMKLAYMTFDAQFCISSNMVLGQPSSAVNLLSELICRSETLPKDHSGLIDGQL